MARNRLPIRRRNDANLTTTRRRNRAIANIKRTSRNTTTGVMTNTFTYTTTTHIMRRNTILVGRRRGTIKRPTRPLKRAILKTGTCQITLQRKRCVGIHNRLTTRHQCDNRNGTTTIQHGNRTRQNTLLANRIPRRLLLRAKVMGNRLYRTINTINRGDRLSNVYRNTRQSNTIRNFYVGILNTTFRPGLVTKTIMRRGTNLTYDGNQTNVTALSTIRTNTTGAMCRTTITTRLRGTTERLHRHVQINSTNLLQPTYN